MRLRYSLSKYCVLVCSLWCCVIAYGQQETNGDAEASMKRARAAYRQNDYQTAKRELQLAQAARRDWPEAFLLKALITRKEGNRDDAIKFAKEAVRLQPIFPTAHYLLAQLWLESSKLDSAHKEVSLAMTQGQSFADLYVLLGHIELMRSKAKEALAAYEFATQQPAPKNELTDALRLRMDAIRNLLEFSEHKQDSRYQRPALIQESLLVAKRYKNRGKIDLAGVVDAQGKFVEVILLGADVGSDNNLESLIAKQHLQFKPAKKDGNPVPFWLYFTYERNSVVMVRDADPWRQ